MMKSEIAIAVGLAITASLHAANVGGSITTDITWTEAGSPHVITQTLVVQSGVTLTLQPGAAVHLAGGVDLVVTNGGRLLAEGTAEKPVRFSRPPGVRKRWGGIVIEGGPGSPESRIAFAHIEGNDFTAIYSKHGTVRLDSLTFGTRDRQYLSLDGSSFVISRCHFRGTTGEFEPIHGSGGVKEGGRAIFRENFFGISDGYSDIIDFTGSRRLRGQSIVQFLNNVFAGSTDDAIDIDGTDSWIEGNIFLHIHKNGAPDTASAISGGSNGRDTSQVTIVGNLFFDCDQAVTAKQGNFFTLINNTIVHMTRTGGLDTDDGATCVRDLDPEPTDFGRGLYLEGNIVMDVTRLVRNYESNKTTVTWNNNILPMPWNGPGVGNLVGDPKFKRIPELAETQFTNWADAQILRQWLSLQPGSPALGAGPNGRDIGGAIPMGISISGEPKGTTSSTRATLVVGFNRKGHGIPEPDWPLGAGYTHYRWRLDGGAWNADTPIGQPIELTGLGSGPHQVEVVGKRDSGTWQNDPDLGASAVVTRSRTWTVQPGQ